jgi:hypothetical protein
VVSAPMRMCEVIKTNRYTFRPYAERHKGRIRADGRTTAVTIRLIGYARISTEDPGTDPQLDEQRVVVRPDRLARSVRHLPAVIGITVCRVPDDHGDVGSLALHRAILWVIA